MTDTLKSLWVIFFYRADISTFKCENMLMPSGVKGTRWLPHVSRALETFLKPGQFTAVYYHMDHLAGSSANADIAGRATKASAFFQNIPFIRDTYTIVIDFIFFRNLVHQCSM